MVGASPERCRISASSRLMRAGSRKPIDCPVGVIRTDPSSSRAEMLPELPQVRPRSNMLLARRQICSRSRVSSDIRPLHSGQRQGKEAGGPKLPDLSARATGSGPVSRTSGTPGARRGPICSASAASPCTAAPEVSPPATTIRRTPCRRSPAASSAKKPSSAPAVRSRPRRACTAATVSGSADEKIRGGRGCDSAQSHRLSAEMRPSRTSSALISRDGAISR